MTIPSKKTLEPKPASVQKRGARFPGLARPEVSSRRWEKGVGEEAMRFSREAREVSLQIWWSGVIQDLGHDWEKWVKVALLSGTASDAHLYRCRRRDVQEGYHIVPIKRKRNN